MNKLFTKIAGLTLGLSLVVGGGAFLAKSASKDVRASEAVAASCDLTDTNVKTTGYSKEHTVGDYIVYGGQNNNGGWAYYKFGAKKASSSDPVKVTEAYVKGTTAFTEDITKVEVILLAGSSSTSVNVTWTVDYSSVADFATKDTVDNGTLTQKTAGSYISQPTSGTFGANKYFQVNFHIENNTTTNGVLFVTKVNFYHESSIPVGTLEIVPFSSTVLQTGATGALNYSFTPASGDSAYITTETWSSSASDVLSVTGSNYTAESAGKFRLSLSATDSNGQNYNVDSDFFFVSNALSFSVGDSVAIFSNTTTAVTDNYELTGINKDGSTHYGTAASFSGDPEGTYPLEVGVGDLDDTYTFSNNGNFLYWGSGNALSSSTSVSDKSSWYVIAHDDYVEILNAHDNSRDLLLNYNSGAPRFACYQGNTTYPRSNIFVLPEPANPRGSIAITSPTDTLVKVGDSGALSYEWTPNTEAPSETISSITWTSSDSNVISVDNSLSTYEAIAPGVAKLSYEATDSLGEVYSGSTSNITVVNKVSGSYVKYTSLSVGDTVTIVCETDTTQLAGIVKISSNDVGDYAYYDPSPASLYDLTVEEGSAVGSFAFATSESKYLTWSSGNTLTLSEDITDNSSWTVSFDEGNANINNIADSTRVIRWNHSSPRFATYAGGQTAVQLYGPDTDIVLSENALNFVNGLLGLTCDESGQTAPSTETWGDLNTAYTATGPEEIPAAEKLLIQGFDAVEHLSPVTNREKLEQAMAKYDYVVAKYNKGQGLTTEYPDFIERDPAPLRNVTPVVASESSNSAITIVVVIAITSVTSIGVLLVLKRRKSY